MNKKVDEYINKQEDWKEELIALRAVLLTLPFEEDIKWGIPAYIFKNKNILGIAAFKNYCGLWFHQGVFLKDKTGLLINAQKDKTKGMRQMRFTSLNANDLQLVKKYALEAIENAKAGKEIKPKRNTNPVITPKELTEAFSINKSLHSAYQQLTLSKKREYSEYIATAKRDTTKLARLQKIIPLILEGKGLNDKYKKG
jgi:uncharacterized protein YdeI (YjbR/CyaY-like superfamily)